MSFATYARLPHTVIVLNCKNLAGHGKGFKFVRAKPGPKPGPAGDQRRSRTILKMMDSF